MLKSVKHNSNGKKRCAVSRFYYWFTQYKNKQKKYSAKPLAGRAFQRSGENKNKKYLVGS
jgi:hypothetical protein